MFFLSRRPPPIRSRPWVHEQQRRPPLGGPERAQRGCGQRQEMKKPGVDAAYGYTQDRWHARHPSQLAASAARLADTITRPAPGVETLHQQNALLQRFVTAGRWDQPDRSGNQLRVEAMDGGSDYDAASNGHPAPRLDRVGHPASVAHLDRLGSNARGAHRPDYPADRAAKSASLAWPTRTPRRQPGGSWTRLSEVCR